MARSGFTGLVIQIDQWQANSPSGGELAGDHALVGPSGTGAFSGQSNNLGFYNGVGWKFIAATALRGVWLFRKSANTMYWHDGTVLVGPLTSGVAALDVMTTRGDQITRGASGPQRVAKGSDGDFWKMVNGNDPGWASVTIPTDYGPNLSTAFFTFQEATAVGARKVGLGNLVLSQGGIIVPAGRTLQIMRTWGGVKTGATAGSNYDVRLIARKFVAAADLVLCTRDDQSENTWVDFDSGGPGGGDPDTLAEITGPEEVAIGWYVEAGSTGALANVPHTAGIGFFTHE